MIQGRVDRIEGAGRGIWQRGGGQREVRQWGWGGGGVQQGRGRKMVKIRGDFIDGSDGMQGWT